MKIKIVAAMGNNKEIGINSNNAFKLPNWVLPEDTDRFLKLTENHPIIVGRKTLKAILSQTKDGGAYPNRLSIVLTHNKNSEVIQGVVYVHNFSEAIKVAKEKMPGKDIYILGGAEIYNYFINVADILDVTRVNGTFKEANVYFPAINWNDWVLIDDKKGAEKIKENINGITKEISQSHDYRFMVYERKKILN